MSFDPVLNFAKVQVSMGYNDTDLSVALQTGDGAKLPAPAIVGAFNLVWWNFSDYADPADDPNVEIVRVTARSGDTLTITRHQEGTSASTKNTAGKTYKMILAATKKTYDDVATALSTSAGLAAQISDETGSGALVFATSPTLVTPNIGVATATSVNKITITAPASGATLTIQNGFTLTVSGNATVSGTNTGDQTIALASGSTGITSGTNTSVLFDDNGVVGEDAGLTYSKASPKLTLTNSGIGVTSTDGSVLSNATVATSGVQVQYSPRHHFISHAWNTSGTPADNYVEFINEVRPAAGSSPTGRMVWSSRISAAGSGSFNDVMSLNSNGTFMSGPISSGANWAITNSGTVNFTLGRGNSSGNGVDGGTEILDWQSNGNALAVRGALSLGTNFASRDLFLTRQGAANLQFGAADAASPVAQTLSFQSVVAGTSNTNGANTVINLSKGTGTGNGGNLTINLAFPGTTGTAQNSTGQMLNMVSSSGLIEIGDKSNNYSNASTIFSYAGNGFGSTGFFFRNNGATTSGGNASVSIQSGTTTVAQIINTGAYYVNNNSGRPSLIMVTGGTATAFYMVIGTTATGPAMSYLGYSASSLTTTTPSIVVTWRELSTSTTTVPIFQVRTLADTTLTASTEAVGNVFGGDSSYATVIRQHATGALTTQRENLFVAPTYSFVGASTLTNAATVAISGAPIAGTNATITNAYALWVQAGISKFAGNVDVSAVNIFTDTTTGTQIGTVGGASGQKLGFFAATPIVQPLLATGAGATADNIITVLQNLGLVRQS